MGTGPLVVDTSCSILATMLPFEATGIFKKGGKMNAVLTLLKSQFVYHSISLIIKRQTSAISVESRGSS